jgi:mono/diheme cytochrome c family protein
VSIGFANTTTRGALTGGAILTAAVLTLAGLSSQAAVSAAEAQVKPPRQDYSSGAYLYRTFCASCHGEQGAGDGPVASMLLVRSPDLATIAVRSGGTFKRPEVYAAIDGRRRIPGHGSTDMPIWGDALKATEGHDDAIVKKRIDAIVAHLESLQRK